MVVPDAAPAMVSHLVVRGTRTIGELADTTGIPVGSVKQACSWLAHYGFLEGRRYTDRDGRVQHAYSIAVIPSRDAV